MILVLGSNGFVGKSICQRLKAENIEYYPAVHEECDLRDAQATKQLFARVRPGIVINLAAFLGGVHFGYEHAAEMFSNNMQMQINTLDGCKDFGVKRLINPIGSCVYPGRLDLYTEEKLWDGPVHESVFAFATAKRAFVIASQAYNKQYGLDCLNLVMSNMYGPNDHFDPARSHAVGALIQKMVKAKQAGLPYVTVLGSGAPVREWLYVEDAADALYKAIGAKPYPSVINIGVAKGYSIQETAELIKELVGYKGQLINDTSKLDGALCKRVEGSLGCKLLNWHPKTEFKTGLKATVAWFEEHKEEFL